MARKQQQRATNSRSWPWGSWSIIKENHTHFQELQRKLVHNRGNYPQYGYLSNNWNPISRKKVIKKKIKLCQYLRSGYKLCASSTSTLLISTPKHKLRSLMKCTLQINPDLDSQFRQQLLWHRTDRKPTTSSSHVSSIFILIKIWDTFKTHTKKLSFSVRIIGQGNKK